MGSHKLIIRIHGGIGILFSIGNLFSIPLRYFIEVFQYIEWRNNKITQRVRMHPITSVSMEIAFSTLYWTPSI